MNYIRCLIVALALLPAAMLMAGEDKLGAGRSLEEIFETPEAIHRPVIIWQWMDGLVTREGITRDLEAFKDAGLAGVQNFQIGGPDQILISNPANSIGGDSWKALLVHTLDECERLGLTFGTHNCPGWSSSAYVSVEPRYSMLELVYTDTPAGASVAKTYTLPMPCGQIKHGYYEDVAVMAVPADSVAGLDDIVDLTQWFDVASGRLEIPDDIRLAPGMSLLRIGQTTNGKTNESQAPESGRGLECDKLSREAVLEFWKGYPSMVLRTAGRHIGKTFVNFEIDSYEAGGQVWSPVLPDEFRRRAGYDLRRWLPYMAGRMRMLGDREATGRFRQDWQEVVQQCVAENYYGYLSELAQEAGIRMLIEPYGTGGRKPFDILDFDKIEVASKGADIATEFWQKPGWGWKDMARHEASMRRIGRPLLIAEAFTCWPLHAWQDSPQTLKPVCDRAFCKGVNRMMLHAAAANPWPDAEPGMSFGKWGTQFVPGQTWWKAGGARAMFDYMARCQALLQQGIPAPRQLAPMAVFETYRRTDGDTDIIFVCNPSESQVSDTVRFDASGRSGEIWNPYTKERFSIEGDGSYTVSIEPCGSRFLIFRPGESSLDPERRVAFTGDALDVRLDRLVFPGIGTFGPDSICSWHEASNPDVRYFSGTACYEAEAVVPDVFLKGGPERLVLCLGDVFDMALVVVNGCQMPLLWKAPFECDVTDCLRPGPNSIEIYVTNLWPNRMIGDEQEPDDLEWSEPLVYTYAPGSPEAGRYLTSNPDWLRNGSRRPSAGRKTVGCFKFFKADSPLLPSGLLGPARIEVRN